MSDFVRHDLGNGYLFLPTTRKALEYVRKEWNNDKVEFDKLGALHFEQTIKNAGFSCQEAA